VSNENKISYVRIPTPLYKLDGLSTLQVNVLALVIGFGQNGLQLSSEKLAGVFNVAPKTIDNAVSVLSERGYIRDLIGRRGKRRQLVATSAIFPVVNFEEPQKNLQTSTEEITELPPKNLQTTTVKTSVSTKEKGTDNKRKGTENIVARRFADLLMALILEKLPTFREAQPERKEKTLQRWTRDIDLMIRLDHRMPENIEGIIRWARADSFWQANILSAKKLREKFDTLEAQSQRKTNAEIRQHNRQFAAAPDAIAI
jgi:hypothetical protein